jgi:Na+-translocating ferredoxin:NAD+ oxidoreductase RnfD subunit
VPNSSPGRPDPGITATRCASLALPPAAAVSLSLASASNPGMNVLRSPSLALVPAAAAAERPQFHHRAAALGRRLGDPRLPQIAVLSALLVYGLAALDLEVDAAEAAAILATALGGEWLGCRAVGRRFDPRSPLISALSLCLLLRTASPAAAALAAAVAIGSKFVVRIGGKHVFNPSNLALVAMLATGAGWASPGQWGSAALAAAALACLGALVVRRAARADVTWAFLAAWSAVLFGRAAWLGDPLAIPLHQLASGSLVIFAFFMISDPKTTPDSRPGRIVFAALVAAVAAWVQFGLWQQNGLLWALAGAAPLVPLIDRLLPGEKYRWAGKKERKETEGKRGEEKRGWVRRAPVASAGGVAALGPEVPAAAAGGRRVAAGLGEVAGDRRVPAVPAPVAGDGLALGAPAAPAPIRARRAKQRPSSGGSSLIPAFARSDTARPEPQAGRGGSFRGPALNRRLLHPHRLDLDEGGTS